MTVVPAPDLTRTPATAKWHVYRIDVKVRGATSGSKWHARPPSAGGVEIGRSLRTAAPVATDARGMPRERDRRGGDRRGAIAQRGFTLLELLLALAIVGALVVIAFGGVRIALGRGGRARIARRRTSTCAASRSPWRARSAPPIRTTRRAATPGRRCCSSRGAESTPRARHAGRRRFRSSSPGGVHRGRDRARHDGRAARASSSASALLPEPRPLHGRRGRLQRPDA